MLARFVLALPLLLAIPATAGAQPDLSPRANVTERADIDASVSTCIKLGAAVDIRTSPARTRLNAGTCVCIDVTASVDTGPGSVNAGATVAVEASGGAHFEGRVAQDIANSILFPIPFISAYTFVVADICLQLGVFVDLSNSHHDFQPSVVGGCCKRSCDDGFIFDPVRKRCVPGCPPGTVRCGNTCYDPNTKTCSSGIVVPKLPGRRRSIGKCPPGLQACAVGAKRDNAFECVDIRSDIESCGGCVNALTHIAPYGVDCTALPNTNSVTCHHGACRIDSCMRGFRISDNRTVCEPIPKSGGYGRPATAERVFHIMA